MLMILPLHFRSQEEKRCPLSLAPKLISAGSELVLMKLGLAVIKEKNDIGLFHVVVLANSHHSMVPRPDFS